MLRSIRNFIITLVVSGAIFGLSAYYVSTILIECLGPMFGIAADSVILKDNDDKDNSDDKQSGIQDNISASFSMLLINTNYRPSRVSEYSSYDVGRYPLNEKVGSFPADSMNAKKIVATEFIILRGNSQKNEFTYTYIPASLVVTVKGKEQE